MNYAVIMAGGSGKRLWPLSRQKRPKQVLKLLDGQTLLRLCYQRLIPIFDKERIIVQTNAAYVGLVRENLPEIPAQNIIAEPCVRDTAGAIGLAASVLVKKDADATMAMLTADQLIEPPQALASALKDGLAFVNSFPQNLLTFAITPTAPSTEFGYIRCVQPKKYPCCDSEIFKVDSFKEKPDEQTAKKYLEDGNFLWNSGMFLWKAKTILENLEKFLPESTEPLQNIRQAWAEPEQKTTLYEWFTKIPKISIDFAVMENADNVYAIRLDCKWLDLGAFTALADFIDSDSDNNIIVAGHSELLNCKNNIIVTEQQDHLIAAIGLENMVVAHTPDATLICSKEDAKRLKELIEAIRQHEGDRFL
jgi:mannose-1-phosphate guanylyltransferase